MRTLLALAILGTAAVGCMAADEGDTSKSEDALSIPADYKKAAEATCKGKAEDLKAQNGTIQGSFEACVVNAGRVACTKDGAVMPGSWRACQCDEDLTRINPKVSCTNIRAATDAACDKLSLVATDEQTQTYDPATDTYHNLVNLEVLNDSDQTLPVKIRYQHRFPCNMTLGDQDIPLNVPAGGINVPYNIRYTEAQFGAQFGTNTSTFVVECGSRSLTKTVSWTRSIDPRDKDAHRGCGGT